MKGYLLRAITKKYRKLLLSMLLLSAFGCAAMTGIGNAYLSLRESLQVYIREGGYPDAVITTDVTERKRMEQLIAIPGVSQVNARLAGDVMMISPKGRYLSIRAMSFDEDDFQRMYFWEQADPGDMDPIFLECDFAKKNELKAGDTVKVRVGDEYRTYAVAGIVSIPESLAMELSDEISISSSDFGFAYAPRSLLEKEVNPDHQAASQEWQEKSDELADTEASARQDYENALAQLTDAEEELAEKKAEFAQKLQETDEQLQELNKSKEELSAAQQELDEKKAEAESSQQELAEKKAEAEAKKAELEQAQAELDEKKAELEENEKILREQRSALQEQITEAESQLAELENGKKELIRGQEELEKARTMALEKRQQLYAGRAELLRRRQETEELLSMLRLAKSYYTQIEEAAWELEAGRKAYSVLESAIAELNQELSDLEAMEDYLLRARADLERIDAVLSVSEETVALLAQRQDILDGLSAYGVTEHQLESRLTELSAAISQKRAQLAEMNSQFASLQDPEQLRQYTAGLQAQLNALLEGGRIGETVSSETALDQAIAQAEEALSAMDDGLKQIDGVLYEIRTGLKEADEKEQELQEGLSQLQEGEAVLRDALTQMDDGLKQMDDGLEQIADGSAEVNDYQQQINDGFAELSEGLLQIDDYQAQLDEGFQQITEGQKDITSALDQLREGEEQIREGIADAQRQIAEGEKELSDRRQEVENGWIDALAEFADIKSELQKAARELAEWEGYQALCNQFLLRFSPGASPEEVLRQARAVLEDAGVQKTVLYPDSPVKHRIDANLIPMETMSNLIPLVFFSIALVVVYLFMALMIRQCRREIGILRALGFSRVRVVSLFVCVGFIVSLGAILLGFALSLAVRGFICYYFYDILFHLPVRTMVFSWQRFLLSAASTAAVVVLSTLVSASSISSVQPSEAMSRPRPSTVKVSRPIQWLTRGVSPFLKFSIISLLRNKLRFLFSSFCLAGSVVMIFTSFSLISSSNEILRQIFDRCIHYDCQIFIRPDAGDSLRTALSTLSCVSEVENLDYYSASISLDGRTEMATVNTVGENTALLSVEDQKKQPIPLSGNGIVLEKHLAESLGVHPGETVWVNGSPLPVSGVSQQSGSRIQYVTESQRAILGGSILRSLICRVPSERENELMRFLAEENDVLFASFTHSAYSAYVVLLSGAVTISFVLVFFAITIGMVIVMNTSQTNLLEQKKELCVLRTLGFQHREISRYWFAQSLLHFVVSCIFGFPGGIFLTIKTLEKLEVANRTYTFVNSPGDYALTAALVLGFIILSHFLTMRSMKKWDIVEVVKEKE